MPPAKITAFTADLARKGLDYGHGKGSGGECKAKTGPAFFISSAHVVMRGRNEPQGQF